MKFKSPTLICGESYMYFFIGMNEEVDLQELFDKFHTKPSTLLAIPLPECGSFIEMNRIVSGAIDAFEEAGHAAFPNSFVLMKL